MRTLNKRIACVPTEKVSMDLKTNRGMALPEDKAVFLSATVLFPHRSSLLEPGSTWAPGTVVHLPGDAYNHDFNRKVFKRKVYGGAGAQPEEVEAKFILVPEEMVIAISDAPPGVSTIDVIRMAEAAKKQA